MSAQRLLIMGLGLAYLAVGFWVTTDNPPPWASLTLALGPALLPLGASLKSSRMRVPIVALVAMLLGVVVWKAPFLANHIAWFYFLQYSAILLPLAFMFGRTLGADHGTALCSRLARILQPQYLDAAVLRHTWLVTWAWTLYFAACLALSTLLFLAYPVATWSFFTDIVTPLGLASLFLVEGAIRRLRFPDAPRIGILATVRAWQDYQHQIRTAT